MDGGVVSNLAIEAALLCGATHIVALDLVDTRDLPETGNRFTGFFSKLSFAVEKRHADLEMELADSAEVVEDFTHDFAVGNDDARAIGMQERG